MKSLAIAAVAIIVSLTASAALQTGGAPESTPPQSAEARKALAEYDQALRAAQAEFESAKVDALTKRKQSLTAALNTAMKANDLDEAIRIRSAITQVAAVPAAGAPVPAPAAKDPLLNTTWRRFGVGEHSECFVTFRPNGKLDAVKTQWTGWKVEGQTLILLKGDKESSRFQLTTDTPILFTQGALEQDGSFVLIPSKIQKTAGKR